jgi:SAM-dependent methyltransferase
MGCGKFPKEGYINTDIINLRGVDKVMDLSKFPYPFKSDSCDEILLYSVLEHLEKPNNAIGECHRILKDGGELKIIVPHFTTTKAFSDPTHKSFYGCDTWLYYLKGNCMNYYFDYGFSKANINLVFGKHFHVWNYLIEWIANKNYQLYEDSFLRMFPALMIEVTLTK